MEIIGTIFIIVFGTLGHFIFEWSGHRKWAGIFFAVNESTWEHIKLSIYPSLLWGIAEGLYHGWSSNLLLAQATGTLAMMILIPLLFYSYTSIVGKNFLIADIFCFIVSIAAGMWIYHIIILSGADIGTVPAIISIVAIAAIIAAYLRFSYHPMHNFLFKDPISGGYGPTGHDCNADFHGVHGKHHHHHEKNNCI